jgi:hypothetical protein
MYPGRLLQQATDGTGFGGGCLMFATLTFSEPSPEMLIQYIDEDFEVWGTEVWDAEKGVLAAKSSKE